jgi:hypothetical protein
MAIMWDPPAERSSLEPTPAEIAWKQWLMEAMTAKTNDVPRADGSPEEGAPEAAPAA